MTPKELAIREKLLRGINISYNQLIEKRKMQDEELFFTQNGKVVGKKAHDLNPVNIDHNIR